MDPFVLILVNLFLKTYLSIIQIFQCFSHVLRFFQNINHKNEIIAALKINTSIAINLVLANNTILLGFFSFLDYWLKFLIPAVSTQIFNPTAELAILIGIPTNEAKAEIETQPVIAETKIKQYSI